MGRARSLVLAMLGFKAALAIQAEMLQRMAGKWCRGERQLGVIGIVELLEAVRFNEVM